MLIRLLLLLIVIPVLEIYVMWQMHSLIGLAATIGLILFTSISGAYLLRLQGTEILRRLFTEMHAGRMPGNELVDGALILIGGILLLTPGFFTDLAGFLLLVPFTRAALKPLLVLYFRRRIAPGKIVFCSPNT